MSLPRAFGKIQRDRRVAIPETLMKQLGWKIGDQVIIEIYRNKLFIENLSKSMKPIGERLRD